MQTRERAVKVFKIEQPRIGLFAQLSYCLLLAKYCEEQQLIPYFYLSTEGYLDAAYGPNSFEYYFEHKLLSVDDRKYALRQYDAGHCHIIRSRYDLNLLTRGDKYSEIQNELKHIRTGHALLSRHISVAPSVREAVEAFTQLHFAGNRILGVHYRGMDKHTEAETVDYKSVLSAITAQGKKFDAIFLATDELEFFDYLSKHIRDKKILRYSTPSGKVHFANGSDNYRKGLEAVVDCLLLSRANQLIKTPSLLSAWSIVFNPKIPLTLVGTPNISPNNEEGIIGHGYYPESALHPLGLLARYRNWKKRV